MWMWWMEVYHDPRQGSVDQLRAGFVGIRCLPLPLVGWSGEGRRAFEVHLSVLGFRVAKHQNEYEGGQWKTVGLMKRVAGVEPLGRGSWRRGREWSGATLAHHPPHVALSPSRTSQWPSRNNSGRQSITAGGGYRTLC